MKKYLNGDPIPWLTDGENPAVTYLTSKEFFPAGDHDELYNRLITSPLTDYFRKNSTGNVLGDLKNFDLFHRGSVWFFLLAAESGYDSRTDFLKTTADYLCMKSQLPDGGFSFNWYPPVSVGCRTGDMIKGMIKAQINDERTDAGLSWIIKHQRHDGGWLHCPFRGTPDIMKLIFVKKPGNGHMDDPDINIPSCPVATCACMSALIESNKNEYNEAVTSAAAFLSTLDLSGKKGKCGTRCGLSIDPMKPGYSVMSQFDVISFLQLLTAAGLSEINRTGELFNHVIRMQDTEGRWQSHNSNQGMIPEKRGAGRWVTLNALRMIKAVSWKENQLEKA